jgi:hypothetical protein
LTPSQAARKPRPGERVAQMVEHLTFNQVVVGSSPTALTNNYFLHLTVCQPRHG